MVRVKRWIEPDSSAHERYRELVGHYETTYECLKDSSHKLVSSLE